MTLSDPPLQLFTKRKQIYPKHVWGKYRLTKWSVMGVLLGIYYLVPFLRWDRGLHAPNQAILIDMEHRRAYFFFIEIWPHEVYYLTGLLILGAIGLFFVTSLFGRIWCGYACPQTVWTDLFIWVERLVQGDSNKRKKLTERALSFEKIWKKSLTHLIWLLIAALTGGAWVLYFTDAPTVIEQLIHFDLPLSTWGWILALTASTYLMAGFAREQICIYMCPYSRFQSAMFDCDTLVIAYDAKRGEQRGSHKKGESWKGRGHCIDCNVCVQVCPMGIDIRDGLQLECIACGLCVDGCNRIMDRVGLERGLIRYDTARQQEAREQGLADTKLPLIRPRTIGYVGMMMLVGSVMLYSLLTRSPLDLHVLHDRNPLFVKLSQGDIRNGYEIKIRNKTHEDRHYHLWIEGLDGANIRVQAAGDVSVHNLPVFANAQAHYRLFISAPVPENKRHTIRFHLQDNISGTKEIYESIFISRR